MEDKLDDRIYSRRVWVALFLHPTYAPEDQREGESLRRVKTWYVRSERRAAGLHFVAKTQTIALKGRFEE